MMGSSGNACVRYPPTTRLACDHGSSSPRGTSAASAPIDLTIACLVLSPRLMSSGGCS